MTSAGQIAAREYPKAIVLLGRLMALLLLLGLAPVLLLVAIVIYLEDRGPVLFRQVRSGLGGEIFLMYKFRTMHGADHQLSHEMNLGVRHLHRTTRIGRTLRRFGLDELPQLLNVLRGEMCFVGPRPTLPEQVAKYGSLERRRLDVRPGITGWAQINGRNGIGWQDRIDLDIWYVMNRTPLLDFSILVRTLPVLLTGTGVYGQNGTNPDFRPAESHERPRAA